MKKILTIFLLAQFFVLVVAAQDEDNSIPFVTYWSIGDTLRFEVTKTKHKWNNDLVTDTDSTSHELTLIVLDSTDTSYKIKAVIRNQMEDFLYDPTYKAILKDYRQIDPIYKTTETGEFLGIENWKDISNQMKPLYNRIIGVMTDDKKHSRQAKKRIESLLEMYNTKEGIEQLVYKELVAIHWPFGMAFPTKEPLLYEEEYPNLFGGAPLRSEAKIYFEDIDPEDSFCVMIRESKLNPEDTKNLINDFIKKMKLNDKEAKEELKKAKYVMTDSSRMEYFYDLGLPLYLEMKRDMVVNLGAENMRVVEQMNISLIIN